MTSTDVTPTNVRTDDRSIPVLPAVPSVRDRFALAVVRLPRVLGRLGGWCAADPRTVVLLWLIVLAVFLPLAPKAGGALAGAGWQDSGSESARAQTLIEENFQGLGSTALQVVVHDRSGAVAQDPAARDVVAGVRRLLEADPRVSVVVPEQESGTVSEDGRTVVWQAGAAADADAMVQAAGDLREQLHALATADVSVELTGASGLWSDLGQVNTSATIRSALLSSPVVLLVLVLAFGGLVAAGLPLVLTLVGVVTGAGALVAAAHLAPVGGWALTVAAACALALGVDHALFVVLRFRAVLAARGDRVVDRTVVVDAVAETMASAGRVLVFSAVTVVVSSSAVLLVPVPAVQAVVLGIVVAVVVVAAATLTLLPALLGALGTRIDRGRPRWPSAPEANDGRHRRALVPAAPRYTSARARSGPAALLDRWGRFVAGRPWWAAGIALGVLVLLSGPTIGMRTAAPSTAVLPAAESSRIGQTQVADAFGAGAAGTLQVLVPTGQVVAADQALGDEPGIVTSRTSGQAGGWTVLVATPSTGPSGTETGETIDRLRAALPAGSLVGGAVAESHDLETTLSVRTPWVLGVMALLVTALLVVVSGSPLVAFAAGAGTLFSIAAALGVGRFVFQSGNFSGLLGFEPQGFVDAWVPLLVGVLVTAVAVEHTVFLVSAVREHHDRSGDVQLAMRASLRSSGRVVAAAAGVLVAVFATFASSAPLSLKEVALLLAVGVLLDVVCIRLVVLPALLHVSGAWTWWKPERLARALPDVGVGHRSTADRQLGG